MNPMTFSASRIQTWLGCEVKAGFEYIAGYEDPGTDATDLGGEVHRILEAFKRDGVPINVMTEAGAIAIEALPFCDDFRSELEGGDATFEGEFTFKGPKHAWRGAQDLRRPGVIGDYKTTSDFKWMKTPEELLHDPQAVLYAAREFSRWAGDTIELRWIYLLKVNKRNPRSSAREVRLTMTREHAARAFAALEAIATDFQAAAAAAPADPSLRHRFVLDTLQPNYNNCRAYHCDCPHMSRCPQAPFFSEPTPGKKPMTLLERLQQMDAVASAGGNPIAPPALPPNPFAPAVPGGASQTMVGVPSPLVALPGGGVALAPPPGPFAPGDVFADTAAAQGPFKPIDSATPPTDAPPQVAGDASASVATPGQINPPKRRPGRPPGAKNKPKGPEATIEVPGTSLLTGAPVTVVMPPPAPPVLTVAPVDPAPARTQTVGHRILALFVGCRPTTMGNAVDFDALVAKAKIAIGPAAYYAAYGYKANGMLLQMIEAIVQHDKPEAVVVAYPNAPEANLCLSHLRSISDGVVEAIR